MTRNRTWITLGVATAAVAGVAGIATAATQWIPAPNDPRPTGPAAVRAAALQPADSQQPSSGICPTVEATVVVVKLNPDTPSPRCVKVNAAQRLRVTNTSGAFGQTGMRVSVTVAGYETRQIAVGGATTFDRPFGQYLAPGVHNIRSSLYPNALGAQVWVLP